MDENADPNTMGTPLRPQAGAPVEMSPFRMKRFEAPQSPLGAAAPVSISRVSPASSSFSPRMVGAGVLPGEDDLRDIVEEALERQAARTADLLMEKLCPIEERLERMEEALGRRPPRDSPRPAQERRGDPTGGETPEGEGVDGTGPAAPSQEEKEMAARRMLLLIAQLKEKLSVRALLAAKLEMKRSRRRLRSSKPQSTQKPQRPAEVLPRATRPYE